MQQNCFQRQLSNGDLSSSILKIRRNPFGATRQKLSPKHFELLTQGTHLAEITRSDKKCTKCVCYFYGKVKEERITAT